MSTSENEKNLLKKEGFEIVPQGWFDYMDKIIEQNEKIVEAIKELEKLGKVCTNIQFDISQMKTIGDFL